MDFRKQVWSNLSTDGTGDFLKGYAFLYIPIHFYASLCIKGSMNSLISQALKLKSLIIPGGAFCKCHNSRFKAAMFLLVFNSI